MEAHQLEVVTYRIAQRMAAGQMPVEPGISCQLNLGQIVSGNASNWYVVHLEFIEEDVVPGWINARVRYEVNAQSFGRGWLPVTWYAGEPTDWHTGLVRAALVEHTGRTGGAQDWNDVPWALTFRRAQ